MTEKDPVAICMRDDVG